MLYEEDKLQLSEDVVLWNRSFTHEEVYELYLGGFGPLTILERMSLWLFPRQYPLLIARKNNQR